MEKEKMKSILATIIVTSMFIGNYASLDVSTTAAVTVAGSIIKARNIDDTGKKYKRKDCPVCKGAGWYWSGDGIKKVDCGYCEPETKTEPPKVIVHPPATIKQSCPDGVCRPTTR